MAANRVSSILAADFGSVQTRVVLFDIVDGEYRVVAHEEGLTTLGYPHDDLNVGLSNMLEHVADVSERKFYNQVGRIVTPEDRNRVGVDLFVTTSSAGRPIRAILVGLVPEISIESALKAISGTYIEPIAHFHLRDGYTETDRMNRIVIGRPDLIFVAGGTDKGAVTPLENILHDVETGLKLIERSRRPPVLYAGNTELQPFVSEMFGDLTTVLMSDNLRPSIDHEQLDAVQIALGNAYDDHRETHGEAFRVIGEMSSTGLLPSAQSYGLVGEYFAKTRRQNVIAVDMGSTSSVLVGSFNGETITRISTTKGLGQSALTLLNDVGEDAIAEWLPFYPHPSEIRNYALNKVSRPASIPMNLRDMFIEQAMMRAGIRQMVERSRPVWKDVNNVGLLPEVGLIVIGGGALNGTGNPVYDMMLVADCLQPTGITEIKADRVGIIPPIEAIARAQPEAAVQILDGGNLEHLGTLISLEGRRSNRLDAVAANLVIQTDDEPVKYDLKSGELLSLPVPENFDLEIRIRCRRGFKLNGKSRAKLKLKGGTAGVVIDARGRNLNPPATVVERMRLLPQWISSATDDEVFDLPEEWAIEPIDARGRATVNLQNLRSDNAAFGLREEPVKQSDFNIDDLLDEDDQDIFADVADDNGLDDLRGL